jgi:PIN domain nuclease of toxin-antitoxin system
VKLLLDTHIWLWSLVAAHELPFQHSDSADRFLAATAEILNLTLVTADQRLLGLGKISTLANR